MRRLSLHLALFLLVLISPSAIMAGGEILRFPEEPAGGAAPLLAPSGTDIRFVLSGNRSEGVEWTGTSSAPAVASPVHDGFRYIPEGADGSGGGKFHLLFRTGMPGKTTITLQYGARDLPPLKTYRIDVTVPAPPNPEELFPLIDSSGDGVISRDEFLAASTIPLRVDIQGTFSIPLLNVDRDGDGTVSFAELKESLFRRMDQDGSGGASREEFHRFLGGTFVRFSP